TTSSSPRARSRRVSGPVTRHAAGTPTPGFPFNPLFPCALFPLVIIAALVWLAITTLGNHGPKPQSATTSELIQWINSSPRSFSTKTPVVVDPNHQSISFTYTGTPYTVNYATPQSENAIEQLMVSHGVEFNSKGIGSSPWWSILTGLLPFVLLFGFWIFLMNQVQGGGSKVMSFGKSRAKRMTPDSPKIGFKDVAGVDEAVEELQEIKEFLENPKKFQ